MKVRCEEGEERCDICMEEEEEEEEEIDGTSEIDETDELDETDEIGELEEMEVELDNRRRDWQQQSTERQRIRDRVIGSVRDEILGVEILKQRLERWAKRCGIYEGAGIGGVGHRLGQCREAKGQDADKIKEKIRQEIKFVQFGQCFRCGLPIGMIWHFFAEKVKLSTLIGRKKGWHGRFPVKQ